MNDTKRCRCACGYKCGGPGRCQDPKCLFKADGNHFVRDCEHKWGSELKDLGDGCSSVVCTVCGMSCIAHDMMCGP